MKTRLLALALPLLLGPLLRALPSHAQEADIEALMREMRGESPAASRDANAWQTAYTQVLGALLPDMSSDDLSKRASAQDRWEKIVLRAARPGDEARRASLAHAMLAQIGAQTPQPARLWLLKMLEWSGRAESVTPLFVLLGDADTQVSERARRALANNPSPEAGRALLTALFQASTSALKAPLIDALGFRRETDAVPALKSAFAEDKEVAAQSVRALANIGTPQAAMALATLRPQVHPELSGLLQAELIEAAARVRTSDSKAASSIFESIYKSGPPHLKAAALRGLVQVRGANALPLVIAALRSPESAARAARLSLLIPGAATARRLASTLPTLPASSQQFLLPALAERAPGDRDAKLNTSLSALLKSTSASPEVKGAAARALGQIGGASDLPALLALATSEGPAREGARAALGRLGVARRDGSLVEDRLIETAMGTAKGASAGAKSEAIRALSARRSEKAMPVFVRLLDDASGDVGAEAARALGENGGVAQVPILVSWMARSGQIAPAERALITILGRVEKAQVAPTPFLQVLLAPDLTAPVRASAYKLLGVLGSREGFNRVRADTDSADENVRDAAIRALSEWPGGEALPALLEIARTSARSSKPVHQVLALRGVARLAPNTDDDAQKVAALRDGLQIAPRVEEKQLLLAALGNVRSPEAIDLAQSFLADEALRDDAGSAILRIARELRNASFERARPALRKAFEATQNADLKRDLQQQIDRK